MHGHESCVRVLTENGADVNKMTKGGFTALMRAALREGKSLAVYPGGALESRFASALSFRLY